ncbi:RNA polymerase sigma factor [Planctomycetaceae bacterium SH139]
MLEGAVAGDHAAWAKLVKLYRPLIVKELTKVLYQFDPSAADDIVQNVFVVLLHRIASFQHRGPGSFRAFLREISRRQALAWINRRSPGQLPSNFDEGQLRSRLHDWADPWSELNLAFDAEHERYWQEKILQEAQLRANKSSKSQTSLVIYLAIKQQGKSVSDVAREHGISPSAGYRCLHAAQEAINQIRREWSAFI